MIAARSKFLREEAGFTLAELMVTMMIMITVLFALYSIFDMSIRVFSFGNDKVEATQSARLGLEKMEREIRSAFPYDKANSNLTLFPGYSANPSDQITFGNDLNSDFKVTAPDEEITYRLSGSAPYSLLRAKPSTDTTPDAVVENVQAGGLKFYYLKKDGSNAATEPEVALIRIELTINVDGRVQTLATDVSIRNRGK